jgi:two-component system, cell cycle response regulator
MPESTAAVRLARRAWRLLHQDAAECIKFAEKALARALADGDREGEAAARLARGFHQLYFAAPAQAGAELALARAAFDDTGDRAGQILATAGQARALWRGGDASAAMALLAPLRDEGVSLLRHEQRGVLLNAIAGCWSAQGNSEQAFAYMYEALRSAGPARGHGFDAALHCNLSHELMELGDHEQALEQIERGLARCEGLRNTRLEGVLRINRVVVLSELGRADEAWPDVERLNELAATPPGRGTRALHFETLAIAAFGAGRVEQGHAFVEQALLLEPTLLPDERVELAVAQALAARAAGQPEAGVHRLAAAAGWIAQAGARAQALAAQAESELHEALGDAAAALLALRRWQALNARRSRMASKARYQAAALQTELLKLQHRLEETDARRLATERARAEMALANRALSKKIEEVQALQAALREQATQDALTGLFNRRHLNDTLPQQLALALRERAPLAAVVIDLDHFKAVNDTHGHAAGDALLAGFGHLLRQQLRGSDLAFRYGGEEFCVLMPHTAAGAARHKVEALLLAWQAQAFELDSGRLQGLGFSAGVADTGGVPLSPHALLRAADEALLRAKRAGRRQVLAAA